MIFFAEVSVQLFCPISPYTFNGYALFFLIVLDLQEKYENSTEFPYAPHLGFPIILCLTLVRYYSIVHKSFGTYYGVLFIINEPILINCY